MSAGMLASRFFGDGTQFVQHSALLFGQCVIAHGILPLRRHAELQDSHGALCGSVLQPSSKTQTGWAHGGIHGDVLRAETGGTCVRTVGCEHGRAHARETHALFHAGQCQFAHSLDARRVVCPSFECGVTKITLLADIVGVSSRHPVPGDSWDRIAARLDEALNETRAVSQSRPAPSTRSVEKLLDLLSDARREVKERELEATVSSARAQRLETELEQQRRRADILVRVGKAINAVRELPALLQLVVDLAVDATGAERGLVVVPDPYGGSNDYSATVNLD